MVATVRGNVRKTFPAAYQFHKAWVYLVEDFINRQVIGLIYQIKWFKFWTLLKVFFYH